MPDFHKKVVKTEKWIYLEAGTNKMTLEQLAKHMDTVIKGYIRDYGPDATLEFIYRNGKYRTYITKPEHLESDQEYNERIVKEIREANEG